MNWDFGCRAIMHGCGHSGCNQCGTECLRKTWQGLGCGEGIICKGTEQEGALRMKAMNMWAESRMAGPPWASWIVELMDFLFMVKATQKSSLSSFSSS